MTDEPTEYRPVPDIPEPDLKRLAIGMAQGTVFTSLHLPPVTDEETMREHAQLVRSIFMPIGLGGLGDIDIKTLGFFWERFDKAGPRSVNGYPVFFSVNLVNAEQAKWVVRKYEEIRRATDEVFEDPEIEPEDD